MLEPLQPRLPLEELLQRIQLLLPRRQPRRSPLPSAPRPVLRPRLLRLPKSAIRMQSFLSSSWMKFL
jgi:hypothetical protein